MTKERFSAGAKFTLLVWTAAAVCTLAQTAVADESQPTQGDNAVVQSRPLEPGALEFSNIYKLWHNEPNLTGLGVRIAAVCPSQSYVNNQPQNDYRFNMNHNSLFNANVLFTDGTDGRLGISSHATAVAGILLGLDASAKEFEYRGACPDSIVTVHEFWRFVMVHLYGNRDFEADLITLSLGQMFETWWTRAIEQVAARKDILVVASIGNGQDVLTPNPLYPGAGSNVLGVGVIDSVYDPAGKADLRQFGQVHASHSSIGPTGDLRCKPDIVAPGSAIVPSYDSAEAYETVENWSSLSAPVVCGTAALLLEKASEVQTLSAAIEGGKSLVLKSILMNSARKLAYWHKGQPAVDDDHETPLDYLQGTGLLDAMEAYNQLTAGPGKPGNVKNTGWDSRVIEPSAWGYEYAFAVSEPNQMITLTLCWNREYEASYPYRRLIEKDADLRLELWGIDSVGGHETLLDYSDSVNDNVEHIYFACDPNLVNYSIRVKFNENSASTSARFALAWSTGPDRQAGDPWWNDINGDSVIDDIDRLAYFMFDKELAEKMDMDSANALNLTDSRAALLRSNWSFFKPRLSQYEQQAGEQLFSMN